MKSAPPANPLPKEICIIEVLNDANFLGGPHEPRPRKLASLRPLNDADLLGACQSKYQVLGTWYHVLGTWYQVTHVSMNSIDKFVV